MGIACRVTFVGGGGVSSGISSSRDQEVYKTIKPSSLFQEEKYEKNPCLFDCEFVCLFNTLL